MKYQDRASFENLITINSEALSEEIHSHSRSIRHVLREGQNISQSMVCESLTKQSSVRWNETPQRWCDVTLMGKTFTKLGCMQISKVFPMYTDCFGMFQLLFSIKYPEFSCQTLLMNIFLHKLETTFINMELLSVSSIAELRILFSY